ncbi:MAG: aldo/keto reductase [Woeseiaceae bacterium]
MSKINRRTFLAGSALTAASCALPIGALAAQEGMRKRVIPGTDEYLPVMGLGAPAPLVKMPPEGKELPMSLIQAMLDHGGRVLDTNPFFRPDPAIVGQIVSEMNAHSDLFLTAKITVDGKEQGIEHLERSVANLGKHPMDLCMVHNMRDMHFHWPTLKDWKEAGKTRYIGVSLGRPGQSAYNNYANFHSLEAFMRAESPDFIMIPYSIHHPETAERVLPLAMDMGTAVIGIEAFKTHDDGGLFGLVAGKELPEWAAEFDCDSWAQFSLKFIVSHPAMTSIVTETSKVKHVIDNMRAGYGRLPDEAMRRRMSEYLLSL